MRETFASHGSSLSKDAPVRGIPAILWINVGILSFLYCGGTGLASMEQGRNPACTVVWEPASMRNLRGRDVIPPAAKLPELVFDGLGVSEVLDQIRDGINHL